MRIGIVGAGHDQISELNEATHRRTSSGTTSLTLLASRACSSTDEACCSAMPPMP